MSYLDQKKISPILRVLESQAKGTVTMQQAEKAWLSILAREPHELVAQALSIGLCNLQLPPGRISIDTIPPTRSEKR